MFDFIFAMTLLTRKHIRLPVRQKNSHKTQNGNVLVVGGSEQFVGAVALAGIAALRSGCDLVRVVAPEKVGWALSCYSSDLMVTKVSGKELRVSHYKAIEEYFGWADCVLVGNGVGVGSSTKKLCEKLVSGFDSFKVIDADGLKAVSLKGLSNTILTPHARELEALLLNSGIGRRKVTLLLSEADVERRALGLHQLTASFLDKNNVIILKGAVDVVVTADQIYYNKTGNAGMTKGGTGDVLAGLCAGFVAQSGDVVQSALNGIYFNGLIGDILLKRKKGFTYLASDMVEEIKKIADERII